MKWSRVLAVGGAILMLVAAVVYTGLPWWDSTPRPAVFTPFDGGWGTESSPWQIATAGQFVAIDARDTYLAGSYVLVDDIDLDEVGDSEFVGIGALSGRPISRPFTWRFDGGGHVIENYSVRVDGEELGVGLFRFSKGTLEAVEMVDVDVEAEASLRVGSLVGQNDGEVVGGEVSGQIRGENWVGGLVGQNEGEVRGAYASVEVVGEIWVGGLTGENRGDLVESRASGDVEGDSDVGGLAGTNEGEIIEGKASGDVEGYSDVGGLVGRNKGKIIEGKASGDVEGTYTVGGLVGVLQSSAAIARSLATGAVGGDSQVGGLVGAAEESGVVEDGYWNMDSAGTDVSAGGVGLTAEEFGEAASFAGFVFCPGDDCRWVMDEEKQRPVLKRYVW